MKKITRSLMLGFLGLFINVSHGSICTKPLLVGFELWAPYQYLDKSKKDMPATGFDAEFIRTITASFGCEVAFITMPWRRQQLNLETGAIDLGLAAIPTAEREKYAYFSVPYRNEVVRLYISKKYADLKIDKIAQLKDHNLLIGAELGFYYGEEFTALMDQHDFAVNVRQVAATQLNISRLIDQQIDCFIGDEKAVDYYLSKNNIVDKVIKHDLVVNSSPVRIIVSKANRDQAFMEKLDQTIAKFKSSNAYLDLENKFFK